MENKVVVVDGKSVLYRRNRSSRWQCRIKLKDGTWHRVSTGTCDLEEATDKAVEYYHNARVKTQLKLPQASRRFKSVAQLAINQMNTALEHNRGKKVFKDYIAALNQYFIPYFGNYSIGFYPDFTDITKQGDNALLGVSSNEQKVFTRV